MASNIKKPMKIVIYASIVKKAELAYVFIIKNMIINITNIINN